MKNIVLIYKDKRNFLTILNMHKAEITEIANLKSSHYINSMSHSIKSMKTRIHRSDQMFSYY